MGGQQQGKFQDRALRFGGKAQLPNCWLKGGEFTTFKNKGSNTH